ncbi:hypothetical protein DMA11_20330 [Marinilabiliaceae bacterium JC017]|nr:hypothetical protein DMA11_20330 [Marinilabiliaceae bacterium JC017]
MKTETVYRQIKFLFFAILTGLIFFYLVAYFFVLKNGAVITLSMSQEATLKSFIIILSLLGIPASYIFHTKKTNHINEDLNLTQKLIQYRNSLFVKLMTFEGLALMGLLAWLLTANKTYLLIYAILVVAYVINYPGKQKIRTELRLEENELDF